MDAVADPSKQEELTDMTNYAEVAAGTINAWCQMTWPEGEQMSHGIGRGAKMASTVANGSVIDAYDHVGGGSHKYVPADLYTQQLGMPEGAGVYGYWKMKDGSYLLRTCAGPLAHVPPYVEGEEPTARWGDFSGMEAG